MLAMKNPTLQNSFLRVNRGLDRYCVEYVHLLAHRSHRSPTIKHVDYSFRLFWSLK